MQPIRKIILSAFACNPTKGSESLNGWNWSVGLAKEGFEVHTFTRFISRHDIEQYGIPPHVHFHYISLPFGLERLYGLSQPSMYIYYMLWQWFAYRKAKKMHKKQKFHCAHHVSWGSIQQGSYLYKLNTPFIFGPAGGGQQAPKAFRKYFGNAWASEEKREKVSNLFLKFNPACKSMFLKASTIWVSNPETFSLAKAHGARDVKTTLDAALPTSFFPEEFFPKTPLPGKLKLLWVGRFMPRKGILLILDIMAQLRHIPSISLTVVGDGEQKEVFLARMKELDLQNTVQWKGAILFKKVREYYANHDVFLFTSLRDSCPAQVIEAMAFGLPVVTINLHGQSEIVNDQTGFRCPCAQPEEAIMSVSSAIIQLYQHPELVTKMSQAAYEFALDQTWDKKIRKVVALSYPI